MPPEKWFDGSEMSIMRSSATVIGIDEASVPFFGVAKRWGKFERWAVSQMLDDRKVPLLATAQVCLHQNSLLIESEPQEAEH